MPSSPKRTPKTGSALLGQELRRLRGGRLLREICDLTRTPPLSTHVAPIAEASLCEIESGKTMPSLQTMHSLSVVYKTSMSQLMAYVTEEKLAKATGAPSDSQGLERSFGELLSAGRWHEGLVIAILGERQADTTARKLAWRGNRATCLSRVGLHEEAIGILTECSESGELPEAQRLVARHNLAALHLSCGNLWLASVIAAEAVSSARQLGVHSTVASLELLRAQALIAQNESGSAHDDRQIREAQRLLESSRASWPTSDVAGMARIGLANAAALKCLGNHLVAARDMTNLLQDARRRSDVLMEARCLDALATVFLDQGKRAAALKHFLAGHVIAEKAEDIDLVFSISFRLFTLLRDERPGRATEYWRICGATFPLLSTRSALTRQFEQMARERG